MLLSSELDENTAHLTAVSRTLKPFGRVGVCGFPFKLWDKPVSLFTGGRKGDQGRRVFIAKELLSPPSHSDTERAQEMLGLQVVLEES